MSPHYYSEYFRNNTREFDNFPMLFISRSARARGVGELWGSADEHHCRRVAGGPFDLRGTLMGPTVPAALLHRYFLPLSSHSPRSNHIAVLLHVLSRLSPPPGGPLALTLSLFSMSVPL